MVTVNITEMFSHREPWDCSNSQGNLGARVGELTWGCAMEIAAAHERWLMSPLSEAVDSVRRDARETGAWDHDEIEGWSEQECLAYLVQTLAAEMRMLGSDNDSFDECVATYKHTDWDSEPEYPIGVYYKGPAGVLCDWHGGV